MSFFYSLGQFCVIFYQLRALSVLKKVFCHSYRSIFHYLLSIIWDLYGLHRIVGELPISPSYLPLLSQEIPSSIAIVWARDDGLHDIWETRFSLGCFTIAQCLLPSNSSQFSEPVDVQEYRSAWFLCPSYFCVFVF